MKIDNKKDLIELIRIASQNKALKDGSVSEDALRGIAVEVGVSFEEIKDAYSDLVLLKKKKIFLRALALAAPVLVLALYFLNLSYKPISSESDQSRLEEGLSAIKNEKRDHDLNHRSKLKDIWSEGKKINVAVLPFRSIKKDMKGIAEGFGESLLIPLSKIDNITLLERMQIDQILKEIDFNQSDYVDPAFAIKIGKVLSVDVLVVGSLQMTNDQLKVTARVLSAGKGEILFIEELLGSKKNIFPLQSQFGENLAKHFKINE